MTRPAHPWHATPAHDVLSVVGSEASGLSDAEAARRLRHYGPNLLTATPAKPVWRILVRQVESVVVGLLIVATVLAWRACFPPLLFRPSRHRSRESRPPLRRALKRSFLPKPHCPTGSRWSTLAAVAVVSVALGAIPALVGQGWKIARGRSSGISLSSFRQTPD